MVKEKREEWWEGLEIKRKDNWLKMERLGREVKKRKSLGKKCKGKRMRDLEENCHWKWERN